MKELKTIRGMPDLFGSQIQGISFVEKTCEKIFKSFNFQEFRTPILENKSLFKRSVGDTSEMVQKEMYELKDRKGEELCLRPEGTAGLVRALITNNLDGTDIKKFFYIGPMFRYERPQKGRKRQFCQAGIELIGDSSINADIEVIQIATLILKELDIQAELQINFIGDLESLDGYRKYLRDYLKEYKSSTDEKLYSRLIRNPLRAMDSKDANIKELMKNAKKISEFLSADQLKKYDEIKSLLTGMEIKFTENPDLVRGMDYYTGTVFEFTNNQLGAQNSILGGGRYDNLISDLGGNRLPATGFALGVDRLAEIVKMKEQQKDLFLGSLDSAGKAFAQKLSFKIRSRNPNLVIETYLGQANIGKQLKKADSLGFKSVIIIGQEELNSGLLKVKYFDNNLPDLELTEDQLLEKLSC
ncbi:histidine--tRNA ligase [Bacteroidota bacterium]|jgi:histidyl-tRNA synthetase|nr:histidine--tRNA ligase [Gammaproteobacteria bacterium]MDA9716066.1 histidine--tRNA ligase [Bacteroidota bacterium]MEC7859255.1 histidine--tRNA ligase [Pseudomonadota bacterium]MEC8153106.1 histidine--tRNA ligase [Pseudomonadota bacterium]|tara:strand:+ start:6881 stop:8122 length:1242 start_codon:yes stop_codon:yes gene_type:complete